MYQKKNVIMIKVRKWMRIRELQKILSNIQYLNIKILIQKTPHLRENVLKSQIFRGQQVISNNINKYLTNIILSNSH